MRKATQKLSKGGKKKFSILLCLSLTHIMVKDGWYWSSLYELVVMQWKTGELPIGDYFLGEAMVYKLQVCFL